MKLLKYDENLNFFIDFDYIIRIIKKGKFYESLLDSSDFEQEDYL